MKTSVPPPLVAGVVPRHPRLRPTRIGGFVAVCAVLVIALALAVRAGAVDDFDTAVSSAMASLRFPAGQSAFLALTALGSDNALVGMVLAATALLAGLSRRARLVPLWLAFLGAEATTYGLKYLIGRPRPPVLPGVGHALTPSFPSAHSAGTAIVVGMIAAIVASERPPGASRHAIYAGASLIALIIGFSRVYLNLHYCSDVLGGFLIALIWLAIGAGLLPSRQA